MVREIVFRGIQAAAFITSSNSLKIFVLVAFHFWNMIMVGHLWW
jgi:hypothetical protein